MFNLSTVWALLWPDCCPGCEAAPRASSALGLCGDCVAGVGLDPQVVPLRSSIVRGWVLGPYSGPLGGVVRRAKYRPDPWLSSALGVRVGQAMQSRVFVDAVVPVPMPTVRRMRRGFDQSERMASQVAQILGVPMIRSLRRKPGPPQVGRSALDRRRLGPTSFGVRFLPPPKVLLVDDVVTTGASVHACARRLRRAGAQAIWVAAATRQRSGKDS